MIIGDVASATSLPTSALLQNEGSLVAWLTNTLSAWACPECGDNGCCHFTQPGWVPAIWADGSHGARCDDAGLAGEVLGMALTILSAMLSRHRSTDRLIPALGGSAVTDGPSAEALCESCGTPWPCADMRAAESDPRVARVLDWWASGMVP